MHTYRITFSVVASLWPPVKRIAEFCHNYRQVNFCYNVEPIYSLLLYFAMLCNCVGRALHIIIYIVLYIFKASCWADVSRPTRRSVVYRPMLLLMCDVHLWVTVRRPYVNNIRGRSHNFCSGEGLIFSSFSSPSFSFSVSPYPLPFLFPFPLKVGLPKSS